MSVFQRISPMTASIVISGRRKKAAVSGRCVITRYRREMSRNLVLIRKPGTAAFALMEGIPRALDTVWQKF